MFFIYVASNDTCRLELKLISLIKYIEVMIKYIAHYKVLCKMYIYIVCIIKTYVCCQGHGHWKCYPFFIYLFYIFYIFKKFLIVSDCEHFDA